MLTSLILTAVVCGGSLGYSLYLTRRSRAAMPEAFRMFFERTGYRYADILDRPLDAHIMHGAKLVAGAATRGYRIHMIRDFHGTPIHSVQEHRPRSQNGRPVVEAGASWWTPLPRPPRIRLQIVERSLAAPAGALQEAFGSERRVWTQHLPLSVQAGDAELDQRFLFFGIAAEEVLQVLRTPGVRDLLLGCAEIDLTVERDRVVLADPRHKNMTAGTGGYLGSLALGADMMKRMELTIPVHDRVAELLATTGRACL